MQRRKLRENKIKEENLRFLKKLQDKQSVYDVKKWEKEREDQEKLLDVLCEYKHIFKTKQRESKS